MSLQVKSKQRRTTEQWVGEGDTELQPPTDSMPDDHEYPGLNLSMKQME